MKNWLKTVAPVQFNSVIDALEELSDVALQRRRWNTNDHGEMSSFWEAQEGLFDDSGLGDEIEKGQSGLSSEILQSLEALSKALPKVDAHRTPDEIIDSPAMCQVRELAVTVLQLFRAEARQRSNVLEGP
jgi:hypothetical protein